MCRRTVISHINQKIEVREKIAVFSCNKEDSNFDPQVIEKRQIRSNDLENRILAMYAKGMSNRDIEDHLRDVYGVDADLQA